MRSTARIRATGSGPLVLLVGALLAISGVGVIAHDPGLSSLDVTVNGTRIDALLSIATPDLDTVSGSTSRDPLTDASRLALARIVLSVDGRVLSPSIAGARLDGNTAHVQLKFAGLDEAPTALSVKSDVAAQLARGHRQLLTVVDGERVVMETLLESGSRDVTVPLAPGGGSASSTASAFGFFTLGIGHILGGFDHLVFLAGLLLASRSARQVLGVLTAFTAAHSITLALAALDIVRLPPAIVEPMIAVSIAWVGVENLLGSRRVRSRWAVVFVFGLMHGFGFAEAVTDLGRASSAGALAVALIAFNAGVEAGQVAIAAAIVPLIALVRARPVWHRRFVPACSVLIVAAGAYWLAERL